MRFNPFKKRMNAGTARTIWDESTVRIAETNRRNYRPNDIAARAAIDRALGVVHACASANAKVCSMMPLKLVRRVDATDPVDRRSFAGKTLKRATRDYMGSGIAGIKAATFADAGGEVEEVTDHPVLDLLARPNADFPGTDMAWLSFYFREITGKSYELVGFGDDGTPSVLFPLLAQFVEAVYADEGGIEEFIYARSETNVAHIPVEDVLFYRHHISRFNPYDGEGPLAGVMPEADLLTKNIMHDLAFVDRGNRPDSILNVNDPSVNDKQLDELDRRINAKYSGGANAHKVYISRGDVSWTPMSWPEKELQSLLKIELHEKRIRTAFGHSESMGDSNASTYAAALVGFDHQYMGSAIRPRLTQDAAQKSALLELFGLDPSVYMFVYDDPVKKDEGILATRTQADVFAGILTINEVRIERGLDASDDEGADKLRINGQTLEALDRDPPDALGGGGFGIPGGFLAANTGGSAVKSTHHRVAGVIFKGMHDAELPEWTMCGCDHKDDDDIAADPMIRDIFRQFLPRVERAFEDIVSDMQDEVVESERSGRTADLGPLKDQAAGVLRDEMKDIVDSAVRSTLASMDTDVTDMFDVAQTSALEKFDAHVLQVADDISETTEAMIRPAIQRGLENGFSIDEIAAEIEGVPKYRAERIARTEVQNAAQGGRYETFKELDIELTQWVNAPGASAAHRVIATRVYYKGGKPGVQKMGEPFVKARETIGKEKFTRDIFHPPARPNCRCSVRALFEDA